MSGVAQDGDGQVAQRGHHPGSGACSDTGGVLAERHVAHVVQTVLDTPVALYPVGDQVRLGGEHVEIADEVDDFDGSFAFDGAGAADLDDLADVVESDHLGGHFHSFDGVGDASATRGIGGRVAADLVPPQRFQLIVEGGLIALDTHHEVPAAINDVVGCRALGMERVDGDDHVGDVDRVEQIDQFGDLVGLRADRDLTDHRSRLVIHRGEQMRSIPSVIDATAQRLAVDCNDPSTVNTAELQSHPRVGDLVEGVAVDAFEGAADC